MTDYQYMLMAAIMILYLLYMIGFVILYLLDCKLGRGMCKAYEPSGDVGKERARLMKER